jgi:chemotaxis protein histidine kinase CheA
VNIMDALVVRSGQYFFAFPIANVITTMSVKRENIFTTLEKGEMVKYLDNLLPLHDLNFLLERDALQDEHEVVPVLVVDHKGANIALKISEFFSPQKLVIISFNEALVVNGLSGATILGGRKLGFIVDVPSLIDRAMGRRGIRTSKKGKEAAKSASAKQSETSVSANGESTETIAVPGVTQKAAMVHESEGFETKKEDIEAARQEFVGEVQKLLPALNEALFALETAPDDLEQINRAFRMLHTIKGNFIMMGLAKGGATIHSVESVLDRVRGKKLEMSPEVMDVLMDGAAYIEGVARQSRGQELADEPSQGILERCAKLLPEEKAEPKMTVNVVSGEVKPSHESSYRIVQYKKSRTPLYNCYIEFDPGRQPVFLVACLIYKRFMEAGDVLGTLPTLEDLEKGYIENRIKILFASSVEPKLLEQSLLNMLTKHYGVHAMKFNRSE